MMYVKGNALRPAYFFVVRLVVSTSSVRELVYIFLSRLICSCLSSDGW